MFDIGFWELALIGVVALLVVGPERLPGMARTVGLWVGRIRRYVGQVRDDIEREIRAEELREMMDKSKQLGELHEVVEETRSTVGDARRELERTEAEADPTAERAAGEGGDDAAAKKEEPEPNPTEAAYTVGEAAGARESDTEREESGEVSESGRVSSEESGDDDERRSG